jgi:predicted glycosyltransferase
MANEVLGRERWLYRHARKRRPVIIAGTSVEASHVGWLLGIPSLIFCEDDHDVVPWFARLAYPLATGIVSPHVTTLGVWERKRRGYSGYQKLAYLHPARFTADRSKVRHLGDRYFLLRLVSLTAHHDVGAVGVASALVRNLVSELSMHGKVYISSERALPPEFQEYALPCPATDIHHALAFAQAYLGDSQSMAVEAAVLGVPGIRLSSFVGRISVLEELEHRYRLTVGCKPDDATAAIAILRSWIDDPGIQATFQERRCEMLRDKIDVTSFFVDEIVATARESRLAPKPQRTSTVARAASE